MLNKAEKLIKPTKLTTGTDVKIVPLGGVEEIGINCTAIEVNNEIIIIDAGMGFPENDQYGVDFLIPNIDYLERNKHKIKAIFITHSHLDHIGALHLVLPKLNFPKVYAPRFATEIIKLKILESGILPKVDFEIYNEDSYYKFKNFTVEFFRVNHSAPDSFGIAIKTELGYVVHSGDFKFDNSPVGEPPADMGKIGRIGYKGVIALMSDSTNAFKKGHSKSEADILEMLKGVVENAEGRIIVATFSQLVLRINQLLLAAESLGRKVSVSGRSLEATLNVARNLGYVQARDDLFLPIHKIKNLPQNQQMILTTGHQGETMAALSRIARGEHRDISIKKGDTVILSSSIIPGNEILVQHMIDDLTARGARVYHQSIMDLHAGGHGYQEDQKLMLNLTKPKFFIPVHGYQSFLAEHGRTATAVGVKEENVLIAKRAEEIIITKDSIKTGKKFRSKPVLVSGLGVGDIGDTILKDREQLANNGVLVVNISNSEKIEVVNRGFAFFKSYPKMEKDIIDKIKEIKNTVKQESNIKSEVEKQLKKFIMKEIEREPVIIVIN